MPVDEPFLIFTRRLNELGIRYMVSRMVATPGDDLDLKTLRKLIQEHRLERERDLASIHQD